MKYLAKSKKIDDESPPNNKSNELTTKTIFWSGVILIFLSAYAVPCLFDELLPKDYAKFLPIIESFIRECGFALVIASAIAVSVEKQSQREQEKILRSQIDIVKKNVFEAVFQRKVPSFFSDEIENCLTSTSFVRRNCELKYKLESIGNNKCRLSVNLSNRIENISPKKSSLSIETRFYSDDSEEYQVQHVIVDYVEKINEMQKTVNDKTGEIKYVLPIEFDPGGTLEYEIIYYCIKDMTDNEAWRTLYALDGVKISIEYDKTKFSSVQCTTLCRHEAKLLYSDDNTKKWKIDGAMLPHNGFLIWWTPV